MDLGWELRRGGSNTYTAVCVCYRHYEAYVRYTFQKEEVRKVKRILLLSSQISVDGPRHPLDRCLLLWKPCLSLPLEPSF